MSVLAGILVSVAGKVGATLVEKYLGAGTGPIAEVLVDTIAGKAGVPREKLPELPPKDLEAAVLATEAEAPELVTAWAVQQKQAHDMMRAEMEKGPLWSWAWRPGGMYLIGVYWTLYIIVYPLLNLMLKLFKASATLETMVDVATLLAVSGGFISLYMGGYTALKGIEKWKGKA